MGVYDGWKIGPVYSDRKGRKHLNIKNPDTNKWRTISYARYLLECHLDTNLLPTEHVHHIDGDCTNDSLENLTVVSVYEHREIHKYDKLITLEYVDRSHICEYSECSKTFLLTKEEYLMKTRNRQCAFYCCKQCKKDAREFNKLQNYLKSRNLAF